MGHIYILSNEAMPGLLKVGFTDRKPEERARELHSTGTPAPFVVEFAVELSGDTYQIEQRIHRRLQRFRPDRRREFFRIELIDAVQRVAAFIVEEQHPVMNVYGSIENPFPEAHEKAKRWRELEEEVRAKKQRAADAKRLQRAQEEQARREREKAQWEADAPRREAARIAELKRKYNEWREEHSRITKDDWLAAAMFSLIPAPLGFIGGIIVCAIAENAGIIYTVKQRYGGSHREGPLFECMAAGWILAILFILYFWVKEKRKCKWGSIVPDEYKEVAE